MSDIDEGKRWWHAYGGVLDGVGCYQLAVVGPVDQPPGEMAGNELGGTPYRWSWDHYPSEYEREQITPPEYRDEHGPLAHTIPAEGETFDHQVVVNVSFGYEELGLNCACGVTVHEDLTSLFAGRGSAQSQVYGVPVEALAQLAAEHRAFMGQPA